MGHGGVRRYDAQDAGRGPVARRRTPLVHHRVQGTAREPGADGKRGVAADRRIHGPVARRRPATWSSSTAATASGGRTRSSAATNAPTKNTDHGVGDVSRSGVLKVKGLIERRDDLFIHPLQILNTPLDGAAHLLDPRIANSRPDRCGSFAIRPSCSDFLAGRVSVPPPFWQATSHVRGQTRGQRLRRCRCFPPLLDRLQVLLQIFEVVLRCHLLGTADPSSREPMPVPYLDSPPPVIPIAVGRQPFVDAFLIENTTLKRVFMRLGSTRRIRYSFPRLSPNCSGVRPRPVPSTMASPMIR